MSRKKNRLPQIKIRGEGKKQLPATNAKQPKR